MEIHIFLKKQNIIKGYARYIAYDNILVSISALSLQKIIMSRAPNMMITSMMTMIM